MMKINWNFKTTIGIVTALVTLVIIILLCINNQKNQTIKTLRNLQVEQDKELNALNTLLIEGSTKLTSLEDSIQVYQQKLISIQIKKQVAERVFKSEIEHLKLVVQQKEAELTKERNQIIHRKNQIIYENDTKN